MKREPAADVATARHASHTSSTTPSLVTATSLARSSNCRARVGAVTTSRSTPRASGATESMRSEKPASVSSDHRVWRLDGGGPVREQHAPLQRTSGAAIPGSRSSISRLEGSGTDQQLLLYEHVGLQYEHDAVVLLPFLQNIRRNMVEAREGIDPRRRASYVLRAKPRFELVDGQLVLRNVPVPEEVVLPSWNDSDRTDTRHSLASRLKTGLNALPGSALLKKRPLCDGAVGAVSRIPQASSPEWQLMVRPHSPLQGTRWGRDRSL